MLILGISGFYHDSAACLLQNGKIVAAAQEEWFTRVKHDQRFPANAIRFCLQTAGITVEKLDHVAFYEKPPKKFDRLIKTYLMTAPNGFKSFMRSLPAWLETKLWMEKLIQKELGFKNPLIMPEHHESHAASAFYPSPFDSAALLTLDGVGEWATSSFGVGNKNKIKLMAEMHFPHSLGLLYSAFTYFTGFKVNSGEYKLMGLAPYGEPKYVDVILDHLIDLKNDGSFRMNMDYFNYCAGFTMTNARFDSLFGRPPRVSESPLTQMDMDLARSIQEVTERIVLQIGRHIHSETGEKNLCLAGGVALNCVANGRLLREGPFEKIWIQPAAGDAGGALGAALYAWHQVLDHKRSVNGKNDLQFGSYLGPAYTDESIASYLEENQIPAVKLDFEELSDRVADLIADENVVGWFDGRMEFGPRALGSRSILGDPRSSKMQSQMNLKIKFRESFRPFAPSVLVEAVNDWFNVGGDHNRNESISPYMLLVGQVQDSKLVKEKQSQYSGIEKLKEIRSQIPAVTHVDDSARVQTVHPETNPRFYRLIQKFNQITGCPVIINTSFNVRGEPIVESPMDAYRCFMRTGMDYLVLGSYLLDKRLQPELIETRDWKQEFQLD